MNIACILFLKNENRFIHNPDEPKPSVSMLEQQLMFLESFVDGVYIVDGVSEDGSIPIYSKYYEKGLIKYWETNKGDFNEQEYCARLLEFVKFNNHHWMLYLDGDEILEDDARYWIRNGFFAQQHNSDLRMTIRFNYINLWRSRKQYRKDKWHGMDSGKMFHVTKDLTSYGTAFNNHFFAYPAKPESEEKVDFGKIINNDLKLLHYAWVDWKHQEIKVQRNIKLEMEKNNVTYEEAEKMHNIILDEEGIVLENVDPKWQEEFRTGRIFYDNLK